MEGGWLPLPSCIWPVGHGYQMPPQRKFTPRPQTPHCAWARSQRQGCAREVRDRQSPCWLALISLALSLSVSPTHTHTRTLNQQPIIEHTSSLLMVSVPLGCGNVGLFSQRGQDPEQSLTAQQLHMDKINGPPSLILINLHTHTHTDTLKGWPVASISHQLHLSCWTLTQSGPGLFKSCLWSHCDW